MLNCETAVSLETLLAEATRLRGEGARMVTATGLDEQDHFEIIYTFSRSVAPDNGGRYGEGALAPSFSHLRLSVGKTEAVPSLSGIFSSAFLIENEMKELLGIKITGLSIDYGGHLFLVAGSAETPLARPGATVPLARAKGAGISVSAEARRAGEPVVGLPAKPGNGRGPEVTR